MFLCWTIRIFSSIPHTSTRLLSAVVTMSFDRNDTFSLSLASIETLSMLSNIGTKILFYIEFIRLI